MGLLSRYGAGVEAAVGGLKPRQGFNSCGCNSPLWVEAAARGLNSVVRFAPNGFAAESPGLCVGFRV